jgi:RNA polymerase sigma-70 factor (ECF subfamily)
MEIIFLENKKENIPLSELYENYSRDIFRYSFSILKNIEDARDAVQDVFVRYIENVKSFKGNCSIKTWLLIITRNYCYNKLKDKSSDHEDINRLNLPRSFEDVYENQFLISDALLRLTPEQNELIFLKDYYGYSYKEIAEITEMSSENVKIKLFRARQQLRNFLRKEI